MIDLLVTRYTVLIAALIAMAFLLKKAGFFAYTFKVIDDCLLDHNTGKYTINNLARFLVLVIFLFLWVSVHFGLHIKPTFKIITVPFTEFELGAVLAFIIGAEWVKSKK